MSDVQVIQILVEALSIVAKLAGPLLVGSLLVGIVVSMLQTITQIQDQTLSFVPKLIVSAVILVVGGSWMIREMITWVTMLWQRIGTL